MDDFNEFVNSQSSISGSNLDELESMLGYKLPDDFKEHYLLFNGGEPENCLYFFNDEPLVIQEFFSIYNGENGKTIEGNYKELVDEEKGKKEVSELGMATKGTCSK